MTMIAEMTDPMLTSPWVVRDVEQETSDTFSIHLEPRDGNGSAPYQFRPGQFNMVYLFGVGEAPISVCGDPARMGTIRHTTRIVGTVTRHMGRLRPADTIGIRGPFGTSWPMKEAEGKDVILVAGGIGLAPLRPVMYTITENRDKFGRVILFYGARTQEDILYRKELERWGSSLDLEIFATVDRGTLGWHGNVGVVTTLIKRGPIEPGNSIVMICGPEVMLRYSVQEILGRGLSESQIYVSLERNMKCGVGYCGHCQLGPEFVCRDGPVFPYTRVAKQINVVEL